MEQSGQPGARGGEDGRHRGVAPEADGDERTKPGNEPARLEESLDQVEQGDEPARKAPAGEAAGADAVDLHRRKAFAEARSPPVGDEADAIAAGEELAGERLGREHMSPGAAGGQKHEPAHRMSPGP